MFLNDKLSTTTIHRTFKPKNKSIFYDICINIINKNQDKISNKEQCINEITTLKKINLSKTKRNICNQKKLHFDKTLLLKRKTFDELLKKSKSEIKAPKEEIKEYNNKLNFPKISAKKKDKNLNITNIGIKKYFHGKQKRYTIYKHIVEYIESNNITMNELINNNPFQTKPLLIPGSEEFLHAVKFNKYQCVKGMLKNNNKLLFAIDYFGQTAYHWAAKFSDIKMMEILISFGMHHNQKDFKGRTPLYLAAINNKKDMCKYLLKNHANPFLKDKNDKTPEDVAGSWELKYFLKEYMSKPFSNPVYKLKTKKILEEQEKNYIEKKKNARRNSFIGIAVQLFEMNKFSK